MSKGNILIVDDEVNLCRVLAKMLGGEGYEIQVAHTAPEALEILQRDSLDVVLTDVRMPGMDGIELLKRVKLKDPEITVLVMTAYATIDAAVEAMKAGAYEYIRKPFNNDEILRKIANAILQRRQQQEIRFLKQELEKQYRLDDLIGRSEIMRSVFSMIRQVADTDTNILILGESGTGKELAARALHNNSARKNQKFQPINCAALPRDLLESELFGHERGAFTGAVQTKRGLFEVANGGTLFLDEIGDMPMDLQAKLLRVIEEHAIRRLGGTVSIPINVRLITATNRDLEEAMEQQEFRDDLFYRISAVEIKLPPLRERIDDIPMLAEHFLERHNMKTNSSVEAIDGDAMSALCAYRWPGNVRELENVILRCVAIKREGIINLADLPPKIQATDKESTSWAVDGEMAYRQAKEVFEKTYFTRLLADSGFNVTHAAIVAGLSRRHVQEKMRQYNITKQE